MSDPPWPFLSMLRVVLFFFWFPPSYGILERVHLLASSPPTHTARGSVASILDYVWNLEAIKIPSRYTYQVLLLNEDTKHVYCRCDFQKRNP
ncbi:hypothetical protein GGI35DRAFT_441416 [Trichoderma velutinum]